MNLNRMLEPSPSDNMPAQSTILFIAGYLSLRMWEELVFISPALGFASDWFSNFGLLFLFKAAAFALAAVAAARADRFLTGAAGLSLIGALLLAATGCRIASAALPALGVPLLVTAYALGGIAVPLGTLAWFVQSRTVGTHALTITFCLAFLVMPLPMVLARTLPVENQMLVACALPFAFAVSMIGAYRFLPRAGKEDSAVGSRADEHPRWWFVTVLLVACGLTFALKEPLVGTNLFQSGSYTSISSIVAVSLILAGLFVNGPRLNAGNVFNVALPVSTVLFLLLPMDIPATAFLSDTVGSLYYRMTDVFALIVLGFYCRTRGASPCRLFGVAFGAEFLSIFLGRFAWTFFGTFGAVNEGFTLCFSLVSVGAVLAMLFIFANSSPELAAASAGSTFGAGIPAEEQERLALERMRDTCRRFSRARGLTLREEDIVVLIAEGKTIKEMEEELFISNATVKTHRRNLYRKLDVHSREELMEAVERFGENDNILR